MPNASTEHSSMGQTDPGSPSKARTPPAGSSTSSNLSHLQPAFQRDEINLLKRSLLGNPNFKIADLDGKRSDSCSPQSETATTTTTPRTSMSQLKLFGLAQSLEEDELENLGITEIRDNFFDPIYNKPHAFNRDKSIVDSDDELLKKSRKTQAYPSFDDIKSYFLAHYRNYRSNVIVISKFTIAFMIALILSVITPTNEWFGEFVVFLPLSTLIVHPVHSIGVQIEMTIQSILGLALGLGWSSFALWLTTITQPVRLHPGGVIFGCMAIGLLWMGWVKGAYLRFYYLFLYSGFSLIFVLGGAVDLRQIRNNEGVNWKILWDIGIPSLFGLLISLVVSLIWFPLRGDENLMTALFETTGSVRNLLKEFCMDTDSVEDNAKKVSELQKEMTDKTLELSEIFREFLSFMKFSKYSDEDLKCIRNHLNFVVEPLRVIPTPLKIRWRAQEENQDENDASHVSSQTISKTNSGFFTPIPRQHLNLDQYHLKKESNYLQVLDDFFNVPLFQLLDIMILSIDTLEASLKFSSKESITQYLDSLKRTKAELKSRISKIDTTYKKFTGSEYFARDLLKNESIINIFLFLRYTRQSSIQLIALIEFVSKLLEDAKQHNFAGAWYWPNYPLERSLRRLSKRCLQDQGSDGVYNYFEAKHDVDDAFQRIYNLNTSKNPNNGTHSTADTTAATTAEPVYPIRAIDRKDFNLHSIGNPHRLKLWRLIKHINTLESKYTFKLALGVVFLLLPAWLFDSNGWYFKYHCFWAGLMFFFLLSPKNSSTYRNVRIRCISWILGCFLGWASNQPGSVVGRSMMICIVGAVVSVIFSGMLLITKLGHPRSGSIGLVSFTVVAMNCWRVADLEGRSEVWKLSWVDSLAILIGIVASVLMNWIVWPFYAKVEIYNSVSSLLSHIGQSYQSISERYLYRDANDDPTDLTLELAHIREVRMSQSLKAIEVMLNRTNSEMDIVSKFPFDAFKKLLNSCDLILEKIIEARMSGIYFAVSHQDKDFERLNKELVTIRRDSVSTVIFILYILANSFKDKHNIPKYLPSTISIRKKLYDLIAKMEQSKPEKPEVELDEVASELKDRLNKLAAANAINTAVSSSETKFKSDDDKSYIKTHWTQVHGMSFSRAYTVIAEELENLIAFSKEILGEEIFS